MESQQPTITGQRLLKTFFFLYTACRTLQRNSVIRRGIAKRQEGRFVHDPCQDLVGIAD